MLANKRDKSGCFRASDQRDLATRGAQCRMYGKTEPWRSRSNAGLRSCKGRAGKRRWVGRGWSGKNHTFSFAFFAGFGGTFGGPGIPNGAAGFFPLKRTRIDRIRFRKTTSKKVTT